MVDSVGCVQQFFIAATIAALSRTFAPKLFSMMAAPMVRSPFRRRLGRIFYAWKRRAAWFFGGKKFARQRAKPLETSIFQHKTPLLRPLKNVEMYLQHNKVTNLRLAAAKIDGVVLMPGETFSFWWLVGKPTARRGYLEGLVLREGRIATGIGGGLCQMGNLLYWMALHSPLTVAERWRHGYDVFPDEQRTLPFGSGATLAWNYIDLQLRNDSEQPFQLRVWLSETHLHGEIRAAAPPDFRYEVFEKEHFMQQEPWGGYSRHNRIVRRVLDARTGAHLHEETVAENHALMMYPPFLAAESTA
jgi:vancomycin resistance protein VanW